MNNLLELLEHVDPSRLDYQEWCSVGMALKEEGFSVADWEAWSARDSARFHFGECEKKWETFNGTEAPVTGGTIYQLALNQGWQPDRGHEIGWNDEIRDERVIVDQSYVEEREIVEPDRWDPVAEIRRYLETLFEAGECVGYVMQSYQNEKGKYVPQNKGAYDRTAGQLIEELSRCKGDIGKVLGDYDPKGGAWIRFNPLDGNGVRNENVSDFRYALVESDSLEIEKQNALLRDLELPIACLVYSGGKSLHAIVKIDAADMKEYRERVNYLYDVCAKNGMMIDTQNRNPSRLSRLPGVMRGDQKQYIIDTNIGKTNWSEWKEWIESVNDSLPDMESLEAVWRDVPDLAPELIKDVLRIGHKMLLTGPSKAGKSFLQIELVIAIAEGRKWLDRFQCSKGRVLYVNLELDRASCLHRFKDVYGALQIKPENIKNIDIWNLRGRSVPMNELAPKLIRRAKKQQYIAIIIDPIYKVITGDENSADQMAKFCNQFDKVCTELNSSVIYCHHHSKGTQGQKKSMDRASGSGVFARDPDALLDMIELDLSDAIREQEVNKAICSAIKDFLENKAVTAWNWKDTISQDDWLNSKTLLNLCENHLSKYDFGLIGLLKEEVERRTKQNTAWRIDGTLREFAKFDPVNIWFKYPVHTLDNVGMLSDIQPESEKTIWEKNKERMRDEAKEKKKRAVDEFVVAFEGLVGEDGSVKMQDLAEALGEPSKKIGSWLGNGTRAIKDLKKIFEAFYKEDDNTRSRYVRKKEKNEGCAQ